MVNDQYRWEQDKHDSTENVLTLVKPKLMILLNLDTFIPIENDTKNDALKSLLDIFEGSDFYGISKPVSGVHLPTGISSRVQWMGPAGNPKEDPDAWWQPRREKFLRNKGEKTFTVRLKRNSDVPTEFLKRSVALENGCAIPIYTLHCYVSGRLAYQGIGELLSFAVCRTRTLITMIKNGKEGVDYTTNEVSKNGAASFIVVGWQEFCNRYPKDFWVWPTGFVKYKKPQKSPQKSLFEFSR